MSAPLTLWRIEKAVFADEAKLGNGARLYGGRWNTPGRPVIYCASSLAMAMLEILVHVTTTEDAGVPRVYFQIELPADAVEEVRASDLPKTWQSALDVSACRSVGDAWLTRAGSIALKVPSVIVPEEPNYLLNPAHPRFAELATWSAAKPFRFDRRLVPSRSQKAG